MKKIFRKLIASAMALAAIGSGASVMAIKVPVSELPQENTKGHRLTYSFSKDGRVTATPWVEGIPGAPKIIGRRISGTTVEIFSKQVNLSYLPQTDINGRHLEYSFSKDGTVAVTRFDHDGTPWAPKIIGQMVDAHTVRIFDKI